MRMKWKVHVGDVGALLPQSLRLPGWSYCCSLRSPFLTHPNSQFSLSLHGTLCSAVQAASASPPEMTSTAGDGSDLVDWDTARRRIVQ